MEASGSVMCVRSWRDAHARMRASSVASVACVVPTRRTRRACWSSPPNPRAASIAPMSGSPGFRGPSIGASRPRTIKRSSIATRSCSAARTVGPPSILNGNVVIPPTARMSPETLPLNVRTRVSALSRYGCPCMTPIARPHARNAALVRARGKSAQIPATLTPTHEYPARSSRIAATRHAAGRTSGYRAIFGRSRAFHTVLAKQPSRARVLSAGPRTWSIHERVNVENRRYRRRRIYRIAYRRSIHWCWARRARAR